MAIEFVIEPVDFFIIVTHPTIINFHFDILFNNPLCIQCACKVRGFSLFNVKIYIILKPKNYDGKLIAILIQWISNLQTIC